MRKLDVMQKHQLYNDLRQALPDAMLVFEVDNNNRLTYQNGKLADPESYIDSVSDNNSTKRLSYYRLGGSGQQPIKCWSGNNGDALPYADQTAATPRFNFANKSPIPDYSYLLDVFKKITEHRKFMLAIEHSDDPESKVSNPTYEFLETLSTIKDSPVQDISMSEAGAKVKPSLVDMSIPEKPRVIDSPVQDISMSEADAKVKLYLVDISTPEKERVFNELLQNKVKENQPVAEIKQALAQPTASLEEVLRRS